MPRTKPKKATKDTLIQEKLESLIIDYQKARAANNKVLSDSFYDDICKLYEPLKYTNTWEKKYSHLYDSPEDFRREYMRIFVITLNKWKPRDQRGESRYNGQGTFKNYFWGSLSHNFINALKSKEGAAKRNITQQCPECLEWVNPIGTHIIKEHPHVLWDKLKSDGIDIHNITSCPFCNNKIYRGKKNISENELIKSHIVSKHLHMLYDAFSSKHKEFTGGGIKITSSDTAFESDGEYYGIDDITPSPMNLIDKLMNSNLTEVQLKIMDNILSKSSTQIKYNKDTYDCSEEEFEQALSGMREKINLMENI
jgi:hypothetical protein